MTAATCGQRPLYEPALHVALRKIGRGEIGAYSVDGVLGARVGEVSCHVLSGLFVARRDGLVRLAPADGRDGWRRADLSPAGSDLLTAWDNVATARPRPVLAVDLTTPRLHVVETEDGVPRTVDADKGMAWVAVCRAATHPLRVEHGGSGWVCAVRESAGRAAMITGGCDGWDRWGDVGAQPALPGPRAHDPAGRGGGVLPFAGHRGAG